MSEVTEVAFNLEIDSSDAAMVDDYRGELAQILRETADKIENDELHNGHVQKVYDSNGIKIGTVWLEVTENEDEEE